MRLGPAHLQLVVGGFDRTAECNRRLEQLLGERDDAAVLTVIVCVAVFVPALRFAMV